MNYLCRARRKIEPSPEVVVKPKRGRRSSTRQSGKVNHAINAKYDISKIECLICILTVLLCNGKSRNCFLNPVFIRQNLTSKDCPHTEKSNKKSNDHRPIHIGIQMKRKELTKIFMMISSWKTPSSPWLI